MYRYTPTRAQPCARRVRVRARIGGSVSRDRTLETFSNLSFLLPSPPFGAAAVNLFARPKTGLSTWRSRRNPRRREVTPKRIRL